MTAQEAYSWAKRFLLLFAIAAISGAALFFLGRSIQWIDTVLLIALCIALVGGAICITMLYTAVGADERLDEKQVRHLRRKLLLFGPLGALEILMAKPDRSSSNRRH
jgi:hypothetical protein